MVLAAFTARAMLHFRGAKDGVISKSLTQVTDSFGEIILFERLAEL